MSAGVGTRLTVRSQRTRDGLRRIVLFLAILMSGGNLIIPRLPLLLLVLTLPFLIVSPVQLVRRETQRIWLVLVAVAVLALAGSGFHIESVATRFANFLAALAILAMYFQEDRRAVARDLFFILPWMAIQALLTVVLALLTPSLFTPLQVGDTGYQTIGLVFTYHQFIETSSMFHRPDGFFFEPGVFQMYLNLYLYLALFVFARTPHRILAVIAVLSTQSTTGVVLAMVLVGAFYLARFGTAGRLERIVVLSIGILMTVPLAVVATQNVNEKVYGMQHGSAWAREYDLYTGLAVAAEHPITGIGFDYERYFEIAARVGYLETRLDARTIAERPNSNGIATLFYTLGFPMGLLFLWSLYNQRILAYRPVVFVLFILSLSSEALAFTPFIMLFVFSGLLLVKRPAAAPPRQVQPSFAAAPHL